MSDTVPEPVLTKPFVLIAVVIVFALGHALFGDDKPKQPTSGVDSVRVDSTYARLK